MIDTSNAGPFSIGLDVELQPGESKQFNLRELTINGKRGYLTKLYGRKAGMDYCYVTNSGDVKVIATTSGASGGTPVPSATSTNFDGVINSVTISVPSSAASSVAPGDVDISVGNNARAPVEPESGTPAKFITDLIPGL